MMKLAPPTMNTVEWISAYAETHCPNSGTDSCHARVNEYKNGGYPKQFGVYSGRFGGFEKVGDRIRVSI
jgi:hypothetical protein